MAEPRKGLTGALRRSVDPDEGEDATEAWVAELDRRLVSVESGTTQLIDAAAVHAHVRDVRRARRASRG